MDETPVIPLQKAKGRKRQAKKKDERKAKYMRAAVEHMDEMWDPLFRLQGLVNVLGHLDPKQDSPESEPLIQTFRVLWDLADEIKARHDGFWENYLIATGQKEPESEEEGD